jgi:prephenate dehydrogenase (NADP+)
MLRIYANQWHLYAGLAIANPSACTQISQFSKSLMELFKTIKRTDKESLRERLSRRGLWFRQEDEESNF